MSGALDPERDEDFLAADFALGTLEGERRLAAERRFRRDDAFRAEVDRWQARLGPMALAVPPCAVPSSLWSRIEAELPKAAATPRPVTVAGGVAAFWRWLAIGSMGLAAASLAGVAVLVTSPAAPPQPAMAAAIAGEDGLPLFAAVLDQDTNSAILVPIRLQMESGQVPELWLIPEGGQPLSLGVINATAPLRIAIAPEMMDDEMNGGALAISLEPEGGSPTGQPTGPVVGQGPLHEI